MDLSTRVDAAKSHEWIAKALRPVFEECQFGEVSNPQGDSSSRRKLSNREMPQHSRRQRGIIAAGAVSSSQRVVVLASKRACQTADRISIRIMRGPIIIVSLP